MLYCNSVLTSSLPLCHSKRPIKVRNSKPLNLFHYFFALACERIFIKTHSTEKRFCYKTGKYTVFWGASVYLSDRKFYTMGQWRGSSGSVASTRSKAKKENSPKSGIPSITKSILRLALLTTVSPELRFGVLFIRVPLCLEMYTLFGSESRAALTWLWKQCELTCNVVELQFLNFLTRTAILLLFFLLIFKGNYRFNRFLFFLCIVRLAVKN